MLSHDFSRMVPGQTLTFGLVDAVGRAIVTGVYDGKRFPTEGELTIQHSVSRSVTREALKMLTAKGLLSARPRQGTFVQPTRYWNLFDTDVLRWLLERRFSIGLLRQFSELRLGIEPLAARLAANRSDVQGKDALAAAFERMVAAEAGLDDALDADIAFHVALLRASLNPFYMQFEDVVTTALRSSIRFTNRFKGHTASLPAHRAVLEAVQAGDGEAAQGAMLAIISEVMVLIDRAEAAPQGAKAATMRALGATIT